MKCTTARLSSLNEKTIDFNPEVLLYAFDRTANVTEFYTKLRAQFPKTKLIGFSTSGHFIDAEIEDDDCLFVAFSFENSQVVVHDYTLEELKTTEAIANGINKDLADTEGLKGIMIISDGGLINGTELIEKINAKQKKEVSIFGGLAGDQTRFEKTLVGLDRTPTSGNVVAIGFYGDRLDIQTGCNGGWKSMGMDFTITKSKKNVLFEIDNRNAYDVLYELLVPESQEKFTKNTLYYPFGLITELGDTIIRTPIAVDHKAKTLTYAGNMPEGTKINLMKSGTMDLLNSALTASEQAKSSTEGEGLVFAVSCVGRRVVLDDMANEEFAEIKSVFSEENKVFGFYSYGEIAPTEGTGSHCFLHNQTFTIANIKEA